MTIEDFNPGQSVNLAFDTAGIYVICYSMETGGRETQDTCFQISVVGNAGMKKKLQLKHVL